MVSLFAVTKQSIMVIFYFPSSYSLHWLNCIVSPFLLHVFPIDPFLFSTIDTSHDLMLAVTIPITGISVLSVSPFDLPP